jgi:two-component system chemotaxis response regulator CheY
MRIIVVDQPFMVALLRRMLAGLGFERVDTAADGLEALGMLRERPYDLIMADLDLPPLGGLKLLKVVRSDTGSLRDTSFAMMATDAAVADVAAARRVGIDGFLLKPFPAARLRATINRLGHTPGSRLRSQRWPDEGAAVAAGDA